MCELLEEKDYRSVIEIPGEIKDCYPSIFKLVDKGGNVKVRVYVVRAYNKEGEVIKEFRTMFSLTIIKKFNYYLDFTNIHLMEGIPIGCCMEILLINFVLEFEKGSYEIPIFPNEFRRSISYYAPEKAKNIVRTELNALRRIGEDLEVIGLLYRVGLHDIAGDITEALKRFYMSDFEGSIKFFRKVIEGLRNTLQSGNVVIVNDRRTEFLRQYMSKAYQLISNFGEHAGTHGFMPEAILSKEIALSATRYLITYLFKPSTS